LKIGFILPRFHPNLASLVHGLVKNGHTVDMCVVNQLTNEDHSDVIPKNFGSILGLKFRGMPLVRTLKLRKYVKVSNFDYIVIRAERNVFCIQVYLSLLFINKKVILYDQYELEVNSFWLKTFILVRDYAYSPIFVFTPVYKRRISNGPLISDEESLEAFDNRISNQFNSVIGNRRWLPFGIKYSNQGAEALEDRAIDFLISAKLEKRKHVTETLEAIKKVAEFTGEKFTVTCALISNFSKENMSYLESIHKFNESISLNILVNVTNNDMKYLYKKSKYFILVSSREHASFSNIEAAYNGCVCVISRENGTINQHIINSSGTIFINLNELVDTIFKITKEKNTKLDILNYCDSFEKNFSSHKIYKAFMGYL
jgi:hypothetical protein